MRYFFIRIISWLKQKFFPYLENHFLLVLLIIFFFSVIFMPYTALVGDYNDFLKWLTHMKDYGLSYAYTLKGNNYFPIFNYILYSFTWIFSSIEEITKNIYYIKIILLAFDFGSIAICGWILKKLKKPQLYSLLILFNPGFFYNSWIWGQIESLYIFFTLVSIIFAIFKHSNWSIVFYILAFYSKLQAIVFLPGLMLILAPQFLSKPKLILEAILAFILTHILLLAPFIQTGQLGFMYNNVLKSVDLFPIVTVNAYNFWVLVFGGNIGSTLDATILYGFSYKTWGMILFCLASAFALWPIFWNFIKKPKETITPSKESLYKILLINALIALIFFYFPTQMHERYLQPAIVLFGMIFLLKPTKLSGLAFFLISLTYAVHLERLMKFLQLPEIYYQLMSSRLISFIFLIVLAIGFFLLYRNKKLKG